MITGSVDHSPATVRQAVESWGARYDRDPKDRTTILNFAAALRLNGQTDQAVAVLHQGKLAFPDDQDMSAAYGKALADNGDLEQALTVITGAQRPDRPDWKLYSAEGAILDQMGRASDARDRYRRALAIAPGEPSVMNNLALSHLLAGELDDAERILREVVASGRANSRVRQNLALVIGLKGDFAEAERVAASELDPGQAAANVAYLRRMLGRSTG